LPWASEQNSYYVQVFKEVRPAKNELDKIKRDQMLKPHTKPLQSDIDFKWIEQRRLRSVKEEPTINTRASHERILGNARE